MEPPDFSDWFKYNSDLLKWEDELRVGFTIPGFVGYTLALMTREMTVILVSAPENEDFIRRGGFEFAPDIETAYQMGKEKLGENFTVTLMTHGANTLPKLKK